MAAPVTTLSARIAGRLRPGLHVEWVDPDTGETRLGIVAPDEDTTTDLRGDLRIGPPGGPAQHLVPILPCDPIYVDAARLRRI